MDFDLKAATGFAVVVAALVAGLFALCSALVNWWASSRATMISRENAKLQANLAANVELAEFRQKWIDCLREDMAKFQSLGVTPNLDHNSMQDFYEAGTRIELRINPEDANFKDLQDAMYAFIGARTIEQKFSANPLFVSVCQKILKREWDVLKAEIRDIVK